MRPIVPDGHVMACPECDRAAVCFRNTVSMHGARRLTSDRYRCAACGASFHEPEIRARQSHTVLRADSLAATLDKMDPDTPLGGERA